MLAADLVARQSRSTSSATRPPSAMRAALDSLLEDDGLRRGARHELPDRRWPRSTMRRRRWSHGAPSGRPAGPHLLGRRRGEPERARCLRPTHARATRRRTRRSRLHAYRAAARAQEELLRTPPAMPERRSPPIRAAARRTLQPLCAEGRAVLSEIEAKQLLAAYGIPTVPTERARPDEVGALSRRWIKAAPCASRSCRATSPTNPTSAACGSTSRRRRRRGRGRGDGQPIAQTGRNAHIEGFTVQPMVRGRDAHELIVGIGDDAFGPVILFGDGGTGGRGACATGARAAAAQPGARPRHDAADPHLAASSGPPRPPGGRSRRHRRGRWSPCRYSPSRIPRSARSTSIRCSRTTRA